MIDYGSLLLALVLFVLAGHSATSHDPSLRRWCWGLFALGCLMAISAIIGMAL